MVAPRRRIILLLVFFLFFVIVIRGQVSASTHQYDQFIHPGLLFGAQSFACFQTFQQRSRRSSVSSNSTRCGEAWFSLFGLCCLVTFQPRPMDGVLLPTVDLLVRSGLYCLTWLPPLRGCPAHDQLFCAYGHDLIQLLACFSALCMTFAA